MTKEANIHNGEKTVSSISGAGKTGLLHARNEGRIYSHITWKNKLKVG